MSSVSPPRLVKLTGAMEDAFGNSWDGFRHCSPAAGCYFLSKGGKTDQEAVGGSRLSGAGTAGRAKPGGSAGAPCGAGAGTNPCMPGAVRQGRRRQETGASAGATPASRGAARDRVPRARGWREPGQCLGMLRPPGRLVSPDMARNEPDLRARELITVLMRAQQQDASIPATVSAPRQAVLSGPLEIWMK